VAQALTLTFAEFASTVQHEIDETVGKRGVPYTVEGAGMKYERGALRIHVGLQGVGEAARALVTAVAPKTDLGIRREAQLACPLTLAGASDAAKHIGFWLDYSYMYT
jgi:hypothetical protein